MTSREDIVKALKQVPAVVCEYGKPIVHYTFIPLIIILGCTLTEPRPTLAQLLGPM